MRSLKDIKNMKKNTASFFYNRKNRAKEWLEMAKNNFGLIIVWLKSGGLLKKIRNTYLLALRMIFYAALVSYAAMNYYILSG